MKKYFLHLILIILSHTSNASMDTDIYDAKKVILKKGVDKEISSRYQVSKNLKNVEFARIGEIAMKIMQDGIHNKNTLMKVLSLLDQCLISDEKKIIEFSLVTFSHLYAYNKYYSNNYNLIVGNDIHRKNIIIDLFRSDDRSIMGKSFNILALFFSQKKYVAPLLFDRATNPIKKEGFEKLHYFRTLGAALNDENTAIRDFLISQVVLAKNSHNYNAITVETAHSLSTLSNPPEEIIPPILEMLEGRYFGDPLLLKAIKNYRALMKPYLERLRSLKERVDERILYGRDKKGKGSSTFSKKQFYNVFKELEKI